jgi:glycosyltransferase involved in cell wall biosynthesis
LDRLAVVNSGKKRIAYIGTKSMPSTAGADRVVEAIVRGLDKQLYSPRVYCSARETPRTAAVPGADLKILPALSGKHLHAVSLFSLAALHALFLGDYDLVHVHNVEACFVLPLLRLRYRVISTSHGPAQVLDKWSKLAKALIGLTEYPFVFLSNCATSVSQPLALEYKRRYGKDVRYIPNGVDVDAHIDTQAAEELLKATGVDRGSYVLFAAGRIIAAKGCHLLLEAYRGLDSDLKLLIVGDASHVPSYEQRLRQMADDRVRFIPFIASKDTLFGLVQNCRLFVFPSTAEAMSMMLLEAASLGVPILCSDIPANVSVLPELATFFESGNAADLKAKLRWSLENPDAVELLAARAQDWVEAHYRWDVIIREYELLYETLVP